MTDLANMAPHEIIARIDDRNRRFKAASVLFAALLLVGLVVLLVLGLQTLQGVNSQLTSQKKLLNSQQQVLSKISASSKQRTAQINDLQQHIDCIVGLFQLPNRQNLKITDVEGCQITSTGTVVPGGSVNGTQKTTSPTSVNNNGGTTSPNATSKPAAAPQSTASTQTTPTNPVVKTTDGLFCPINLTHLACSN